MSPVRYVPMLLTSAFRFTQVVFMALAKTS